MSDRPPSFLTVVATALRSAVHFFALLRAHRVHQPRERLVRIAEPPGTDFSAFRETVVDVGATPGERAVLLVWFRLRFVFPHSRFLAAVFRRVCIMTTPFFAGVPGFVSKLWLEDRRRAEYLGVYEFTSTESAAVYAHSMLRVLRFFAQSRSLADRILPGLTVTRYLAAKGARPSARWRPPKPMSSSRAA